MSDDQSQRQVASAFGYKWTRHAHHGFTGPTAPVMHRWQLDLLGWDNDESYAGYLSGKRRILDAGCGNGRDLAWLARLAPHAEIIGIDISDAVQSALENTAGLPNVTILRGDISQPPDGIGTFDYITSLGVLHHTPDTRRSFTALTRLLTPGGELACYIYRKKAPLREFADDLVRHQIRDMTPEAAWREMEAITLLGKALADLKAEVDIPAIPSLGIEAGRHNIQRLIYYTMLKCYWRNEFSFEENVHVNFDWYYPTFAWRHTAEEVRAWMTEAGVEETFFREIPAGLCFRVARKNVS